MASTTDIAATIRADLKKLGFGSRDVSVRAERYSMGATIHVVVLNNAISLAAVECVANRHERVRRDESGEILSGGNLYVDTYYSDAAIAGDINAAAHALEQDGIVSLAGYQAYEIGGNFEVIAPSGETVLDTSAARNAARWLVIKARSVSGIHCRFVAEKVAA